MMKKTNNILVKNRLYILAVSGGSDSLFSLEKMRSEGYNLVVAHVNYKKRASSDYDEQIVKNCCQKHSLICEVYRVKSIPKGNFQDQARRIRYTFFQQLATKYHTKYIIVAHHFDDHLETYLLQKQRRSLVDYWGLPPRTKQQKYFILRPFLSFTKSQILRYLTQKKITYATDSTNQLPIYQRNIIRQKLNNLNPAEKSHLVQEIKQKNQQLKKIKSLVQQEKQRLIDQNNHSLLLESHPQFAPEIYLRLLYFWINQNTNGLLQQSKRKLLNEIYKQLFESQKKNLVFELRGKWQIVKSNGWAFLILKNNLY
ncbi:MAG: tRNA lysidine(34) synthetase TilS [Candidatus Moeniiplasma glomeromycotorum]|nr:tRNA lysidine(34) synthetase TilS [Candidatus Moeniiplasma glomeromycotorum]MCE8168076.1 tRNA lysidine(34) synthetase TilS [Candidatus Moeniiplasma glomeromycotorum]MCE8169615.1 tRNA lysidine(34) synthetase TilS [Candidatus Moeniiplasma glomeromycotorum]